MTFEAYIENIRAKTGQTPAQLRDRAKAAGVFERDMRAGDLVRWLKREFDLGHGHAMAIWAVFKQEGWVNAGHGKK